VRDEVDAAPARLRLLHQNRLFVKEKKGEETAGRRDQKMQEFHLYEFLYNWIILSSTQTEELLWE